MPAASWLGQIPFGVASGAASVSSNNFTRFSGTPAGVYALVGYNGDFAANPATAAVFGSEALSLIGGKRSSVGNVSVEIWGAQVTGGTGTVTVGFASGTIQDMGLSVIEVDRVGTATAPANQASGTAGTTSPATTSVTTADYLGGRKATTTVPATDNLVIGIVCMFKAGSLSLLTLSQGTEVQAPTNVGAGAQTIQFGSAVTQGTGGSDTLSWTESVNREWVEEICEISGCAAEGVWTRSHVIVPALY